MPTNLGRSKTAPRPTDISDAELMAALADIFAARGEIFPRSPRDVLRTWLANSQDRRTTPPDLDCLLSEASVHKRASVLEAAAQAYASAILGDLPTVELSAAARNLESALTPETLAKMRSDRQQAIQEQDNGFPSDGHRRAR